MLGDKNAFRNALEKCVCHMIIFNANNNKNSIKQILVEIIWKQLELQFEEWIVVKNYVSYCNSSAFLILSISCIFIGLL